MATPYGRRGPSSDVLSFGRGRARHRPPRRWPWILGVVVLAAGAALIVVRPLVAAADFRSLQSRWSAAVALDLGRSQVVAQLSREAVPSDLPAVTAAVLAVQRQEAGLLQFLRAGAAPGLARDGSLAALAAAERTALSLEIGDLRREPLLAWSAATDEAVARVQALLAAGRSRFRGPAPAPPAPAGLTAADGALLRLGRLLDTRVPADLLFAANGVPQMADLWSGRVHAAPPAIQALSPSFPSGGGVLPRAGFLAVQARGEVYAVSPTLTGAPRLLGAGPAFPAARPGAVWVSASSPGTIVLVDGAGRRLAGPVRALAGAISASVYASLDGLATSGGLVVQEDRFVGSQHTVLGLWLWDPLRGPALRPLVRGCAQGLAAQGVLLAWLRCDPNDPALVGLHITDTATGADRVIAGPGQGVPFLADQPAAAFSPDGHWLAAYYEGATPYANFSLGLVNVATGAVSVVGGAPVYDASAAAPIMWAADSTRIFFDTGATIGGSQDWFDGSVPLATYRIGARSAVDVRLHEPGATVLAVLPTSPG